MDEQEMDEQELKQDAYNCLSKALGAIFATSGSLLAGSEIRNLNTGLCLLQCGLSNHPLAPAMTLSKKKYFAHWSNDSVMERMLEAWLRSEMLVATEDISRYDDLFKELVNAAVVYLSHLIDEKGNVEEEKIHYYTFIMVGHLARNLFMLKPDYPQVKEIFLFTLEKITWYAGKQQELFDELIKRGLGYGLLDFCLSYFAGLEDHLSPPVQEIRSGIVSKLQAILKDESFWSQKNNHNNVAHLLMDLHIGGALPESFRERSTRELIRRIGQVMAESQVDMQVLTRLTRSLGELARIWPDMPDMLNRRVTTVYSENILDEIQRVVIDQRGWTHEDITGLVMKLKRNRKKMDADFLRDLINAPWQYSDFEVNIELEHLDVVKAPAQTLNYGGDCDCLAALYAALLLAAGHSHVWLFHLSKRTMKDTGVHISYHAVACLPQPGSQEMLYCFDPQAQTRPGKERKDEIPLLRIVDKGIVEIMETNGVRQLWKIYGRKVIDADHLNLKGYLMNPSFDNLISPVSGQSGKTTTAGEAVSLSLEAPPPPIGVPVWLLASLDDNKELSERISKYIDQNFPQRTDLKFIISSFEDPLFDGYRNNYGLSRKQIDYPVLVIYFRGSGSEPEWNIALDYSSLQAKEKILGFEEMMRLLFDYTRTRRFEELKKWTNYSQKN